MISTSPTAPTLPHIGDSVMLRGTRIAGAVKRIDGRHDSHDRVIVKVESVMGKSKSSKMGRAWSGAWVICPTDMLAPMA